MSKPWDKLRVPVQPAKPPITTGKWGGGDYPQFWLTEVGSGRQGSVRMVIGPEHGPQLHFDLEGLRLASEFLAELADQLESA